MNDYLQSPVKYPRPRSSSTYRFKDLPIPMASSSSSKPRPVNKNQVQYRGHAHFRQRVVLAILSGKSVRIDAIRADQLEVGVKGEQRMMNTLFTGECMLIHFLRTTERLRGLIPETHRENHQRNIHRYQRNRYIRSRSTRYYPWWKIHAYLSDFQVYRLFLGSCCPAGNIWKGWVGDKV